MEFTKYRRAFSKSSTETELKSSVRAVYDNVSTVIGEAIEFNKAGGQQLVRILIEEMTTVNHVM